MRTKDFMGLVESYRDVVLREKKKKMDPVDKDELDGEFDDREDKDIDNDGDEDSSDKYLHNRRKAIKKTMKSEAKKKVEDEEEDDEDEDEEDDEDEDEVEIVVKNPKKKKGSDSKSSDESEVSEAIRRGAPKVKHKEDPIKASRRADKEREKNMTRYKKDGSLAKRQPVEESQGMMDKFTASDRKFLMAHGVDIRGTDSGIDGAKAAADTAAAIAASGKKGPMRPADQNTGDKKMKESKTLRNLGQLLSSLAEKKTEWKKDSGWHKPEEHKDKFGNKIKTKNVAKSLAKSAAKTSAKMDEEAEQIDELSKKTLGSYIKRAADDYAGQSEKMSRGNIDPAKHKKTIRKFINRNRGISRATDKLTKEEAEDINEISDNLMNRYKSAANAERAKKQKEVNARKGKWDMDKQDRRAKGDSSVQMRHAVRGKGDKTWEKNADKGGYGKTYQNVKKIYSSRKTDPNRNRKTVDSQGNIVDRTRD
jgi:hypothetical protein